MFESLDDQIKHDDAVSTTPREKFFKWAAVGVISILVFGGIYLALRLVEW